MELTVIGGRGAWPDLDQACSGYLVESQGTVLLIDPGYGTMGRVHRYVDPAQIDAVVVSHRHPDHCADLNPLLRSRALGADEVPPLPVYAPAGALDAVLALDDMRAMDAAVEVVPVADGDRATIGAFTVDFAELPHHVTNLGMRVTAPGGCLAYTGDSGPDRAVVELGTAADIFLIEATHLMPIRDSDRRYLCDVETALQQGHQAEAHFVLLTHLWPTIRGWQVQPLIDKYSTEVHAELAVAGTTAAAAERRRTAAS